MRIIVLMIVAAFLWVWISTGKSPDWQQVALIVGALGAKAVQSGTEQPKPPPAPEAK